MIASQLDSSLEPPEPSVSLGVPIERQPMLDVARGIGIILVLYGHSLETLLFRPDLAFKMSAFRQWQAIYSFHMPLFFVVSGAAQRRLDSKTTREVIVSSLSLLVLADLNHAMGALVRLASLLHHHVRLTLQSLFEVLIKPILTGSGLSLDILWFLVALAAVQLLAFAWLTQRGPRMRIFVAIVCGASVLAATSLGSAIPNWFEFKTWGPALLFFMSGRRLFRERRWPAAWLALPCALGVVLLAPLNSGCSFTFAGTCGQPVLRGNFAVWMHAGEYGYLPLFYLTACLGCIATLSMARGIRSAALAYCGRNSLYLFLVNSWLAVFVIPFFTRFDVSGLRLIDYAWIMAATLAVHLGAMVALRAPLRGLRTRSIELAQWAVSLTRPSASSATADQPTGS